MKRALLVFKPEDHVKLEPGTLLRYLASDFDIRTQKYNVVFEVMGVPPTQDNIVGIQFV